MKLTTKDLQILTFIKSFAIKNGYLPTMREIGKGVNLSSTSTVYAHFINLESAGCVERVDGRMRYRVMGLKYVIERREDDKQ